MGALRALLLIVRERDATNAASGGGTSTPRRVIVRLPNWLGDVLMARPLLHHLRASGARCVAVGRAGTIELLREEDPALELHAWPQAAAERRALAVALRAHAADLALILPISFSSAWHARAWGARRRAGYAADRRSPLLHDARPRFPRGDLHVSEEYLALASERSAPIRRVAGACDLPELPVATRHLESAQRILASAGIDGEPFAILAPGAVYGPAKRWSVERYATIATDLEARRLRVVLCGAEGDRPVTAAVARLAPRAVDVAGRTTVGEAAALARRARVVLSNDSGFAHVAGAVGAPTVVIFGSSSSAWTAPLGRRVRIVQHAPPCSPCFQPTCRIGYACLAAVSTAEVARALREIAA